MGYDGLPCHVVGLAMGCRTLPGHAVGLLSHGGFATVRALVLPWPVLVSGKARATGTTLARTVPASWTMAIRGACRGNPLLAVAIHGSPWQPMATPTG